MTTKWKIILLVMLIILSICGVFITILIRHSQEHLATLVSNKVASTRAIVQTIEEDDSRYYHKRIQSFVNYTEFPRQEEIIASFARQDREKLLQLTTPYLTIFRKENPQFATLTWLTSDNHVFLRVHNPSVSGDDISTKRPDIVAANREQRQYAAYKVSGTGLLYSILQPVSYKGRHLGVLQFGLKETSLLDILHEKLNLSVGLAIPNAKYSFVTNSEFPFLAGTSHTIQSNQLDLFQKDIRAIDWTLEQQRIKLHGSTYIIANILNLHNYKQEPEGYVFMALDISEQENRLQSHIKLILLVGTILLLLAFYILYSSYGSLIEKIVNLNTILEENNLELENKIAERTTELLQEKERLQAITENVPGVVFQFYVRNSGKSGVNYISPRVSDVFGLEFTDDPSLLLQTFVENIHKEDRQSWIDSTGQAVKQQGPWKWKGRYIKPSGEIICFEGQATPTVRKDEIVFDGIFTDITEKTGREKQRLETFRQKEQLKKFESLKTMAGAIAHRFNNAMMAVMGNLDLMAVSLPADSDEYKMASDAAHAAKGAAQVGSMLLSYVGQQTLKCQEVSLPQVVKENINALKTIFLPQIVFKFTPSEQPLYCSLDQQQINKVIESILTNAIESLGDNPGTIEVTFGSEYFTTDSFPFVFQDESLQDGMYSFCQIKDTGHGIEPENLSRIFEPFYTTRFVGRGLGLALIVGIMRSHHGAIMVESVPGKGTAVRVLFPAITATPQTTLPSDLSSAEIPALSGDILFADDEEIILEVGRKMFESLGFTVHTARNGLEVVEEIRNATVHYCAVILDVQMPEMDGFEAMQIIRELDSDLPVILTSGYSREELFSQKGEGERPDAFFAKPFKLSDVRSTFGKLFSKRASQNSGPGSETM